MNFYEIHILLPISAEKAIICLFRKVIMYDSAVEENKAVTEEKKPENMSPAESFMMDFDGSSKDLRGLFKIPMENKIVGSLHQQI